MAKHNIPDPTNHPRPMVRRDMCTQHFSEWLTTMTVTGDDMDMFEDAAGYKYRVHGHLVYAYQVAEACWHQRKGYGHIAAKLLTDTGGITIHDARGENVDMSDWDYVHITKYRDIKRLYITMKHKTWDIFLEFRLPLPKEME